MSTSRNTRFALSAFGVAALAVTGCSGSTDEALPDQPTAEANASELADDGIVVMGSGDARLPYDTFSDWVSYSDAVVEIKVTRIETGDLTDAEREAGAGLQERRVVAEVGRVLWQHERTTDLPKELQFSGLPFVLQDDKLLESRSGIAPWIAEGEAFVVPITDTATDGWIPLNVEAAVPLVDGVLMPTEDIGGISSTLTKLSPDALAEELKSARPHPIAEERRDLDVDSRFQAVNEARQEAPPGEGES